MRDSFLHKPNIGLLLIRVAVGAVFIAHGWSKFQNIAGTIGFFGNLGLDPIWAYVVALVELVGGLLVLTGILVHLAGFLLATVMVGAIVLLKFDGGFLGGYELDLTLLLVSLALAFTGSGRYSLGYLLQKKSSGSVPEQKQQTGPGVPVE